MLILMHPCPSRMIQRLNPIPPHTLIRALDPSIIRDKSIDFAFNIGSLRPDATATSKPTGLVFQLLEENVAAVVPYFGGLA